MNPTTDCETLAAKEHTPSAAAKEYTPTAADDELLAADQRLLERGRWYCCKFLASGLRVHVQYESTTSWKARMGFPYFYVHAIDYDGAERKTEQVQLSLQIICRRVENRGAGFTSTVTDIIEQHGCRFYIDQIEGSPKHLRGTRPKRSQTKHTTQKLAARREGLRATGLQLRDSDSEWAQTRMTTKHRQPPPPINGHYSEQEKNCIPYSLDDEIARAIINDAYRLEHEPIIPTTLQDLPAVKLGEFPLETAHSLCLKIVDKYGVTPYCLNLLPGSGRETTQVVYLDGSVSSRVRKLATAMAGRITRRLQNKGEKHVATI